jgi:hypothetical protein
MNGPPIRANLQEFHLKFMAARTGLNHEPMSDFSSQIRPLFIDHGLELQQVLMLMLTLHLLHLLQFFYSILANKINRDDTNDDHYERANVIPAFLRNRQAAPMFTA